MERILDIGLFTDGFDYQYIDCIQGPIAAASSFYGISNYFNYCFLHSIRGNLENYLQIDVLSYANGILNQMGLKLNKIDCSGYSPEETVSRIAREVLSNRPVVLIVKYNSLFYSMFYKDYNFRTNHGIIVNGYIDYQNTFLIKESTLLRDVVDAYDNKDIYCPLRITSDMLKSIWEDSNSQFHRDNLSFKDSIYSIDFMGEKSIDTDKALSIAVSMLENHKNDLINIIDAFEGSRDFNTYLVSHRMRFWGCLKPIFYVLLEQCEKKGLDRARVEGVKLELENIRDNVLNILNRASLRGAKISEDRKFELRSMLVEGDQKLIALIKSLVVTEDKRPGKDVCIDIRQHYNDRGFEESITNDSVADLTGDGIHYIRENMVVNEEWRRVGFCFHYAYSPGQCDHISCNGQEISIPEIDADGIDILGCAEFGNFSEEIEICYSDGSSQRITADFSDFYRPSVFNETLFWVGTAAQKKDGTTKDLQFNARLFAKQYAIKPGKIVKLILPIRKNIHIFAITLKAVEVENA